MMFVLTPGEFFTVAGLFFLFGFAAGALFASRIEGPPGVRP